MMEQPIIRPVQKTDLPAIQAIYAPFVQESHVSFEYDVPSVAQLRERV